MLRHGSRLPVLGIVLFLALGLAACGGASGGPGPIGAGQGLVLLSFGDLGSECSDVGEVVRCRIGNTDVTDRALLLLTFTPLVFGPVVYLVAAITPKWREPLGLGTQVFVVVTGLSIMAAGFMLMGWGSTTGAIIALAVGGAGIYMAFRSWRARQEPDPPPAAGTASG